MELLQTLHLLQGFPNSTIQSNKRKDLNRGNELGVRLALMKEEKGKDKRVGFKTQLSVCLVKELTEEEELKLAKDAASENVKEPLSNSTYPTGTAIPYWSQ